MQEFPSEQVPILRSLPNLVLHRATNPFGHDFVLYALLEHTEK